MVRVTYKSRHAAIGLDEMQQAAAAFATAKSNPERRDAALWLGEAYRVFTQALDDAGDALSPMASATARYIAGLLGGPEAWERRVKEAYEGW